MRASSAQLGSAQTNSGVDQDSVLTQIRFTLTGYSSDYLKKEKYKPKFYFDLGMVS